MLSYLAEGYVKGAVFGTLVESFCAEQNARMMAMDAASKERPGHAQGPVPAL